MSLLLDFLCILIFIGLFCIFEIGTEFLLKTEECKETKKDMCIRKKYKREF